MDVGIGVERHTDLAKIVGRFGPRRLAAQVRERWKDQGHRCPADDTTPNDGGHADENGNGFTVICAYCQFLPAF